MDSYVSKVQNRSGKGISGETAHEGVKACHREIEIAKLEIERKEEKAMIVNV